MRLAPSLAAAALALAPLIAAPVQAAVAVRPVVVELFTAQGCASCPHANQMLGDVAARKGVLALTFPVDYWDYLGWRDTFAMPEFTARQRAYVSRLQLKEIYTPEVVVGGRRETPGVDAEELDALIDRDARTRQPGPAIRFSRKGDRVLVAAGAPRAAEVWLIRYDPVRRDVRVRTGENAGKTVSHVNVVRELKRLGAWSGRARSFAVPDGPDDLETIAILQAKGGGPILAVAEDGSPKD